MYTVFLMFNSHTLRSRLDRVIDTNHGTVRGLVRAMLAQTEFVLGRLEDHTRPAGQHIDRLVFVCLGNINRSAFAEQVARQLGAATCSIGLFTTTGAPAFHKAIATAPQFGLDLLQHRATDISDYRLQPRDLLFAKEICHVRRLMAVGIPARSIALLGHWAPPHRIHLHDPHVLSDAYFRTCFMLIHSVVDGLVDQRRTCASPCLTP